MITQLPVELEPKPVSLFPDITLAFYKPPK